MTEMTNRNGNKSGKRTGRPKPVATKAGVTMDGKRRYGCGGKIKK